MSELILDVNSLPSSEVIASYLKKKFMELGTEGYLPKVTKLQKVRIDDEESEIYHSVLQDDWDTIGKPYYVLWADRPSEGHELLSSEDKAIVTDLEEKLSAVISGQDKNFIMFDDNKVFKYDLDFLTLLVSILMAENPGLEIDAVAAVTLDSGITEAFVCIGKEGDHVNFYCSVDSDTVQADLSVAVRKYMASRNICRLLSAGVTAVMFRAPKRARLKVINEVAKEHDLVEVKQGLFSSSNVPYIIEESGRDIILRVSATDEGKDDFINLIGNKVTALLEEFLVSGPSDCCNPFDKRITKPTAVVK